MTTLSLTERRFYALTPSLLLAMWCYAERGCVKVDEETS